MVIRNIDEISYDEIMHILNNSGLIIFPTETCYGIGCNPCDEKAVEKLLRYKARREGKAISIAVVDKEMAKRFVDLNESAENFYDRFLPGPFTVISKSNGKVVRGIEAENGTLGVRIPEYPWLIELLKNYDNPITATSANQSYQKQPYKAEDILENSSKDGLELVDLFIDAGELPHRPSSTVVDTTTADMKVLRQGAFLPEGVKVNEFVSNAESETIELGKKLYDEFSSNLEFRPLIFAIQGDLGAGKTHFTKGVAEAMGIDERIQSPTFILSREYKSIDRNMLYHIDTWRLENNQDFEDLGLKNMLLKTKDSEIHNVVVIEWADKVKEYLQKLDMNMKIIWMDIKVDNDNKRLVSWTQ